MTGADDENVDDEGTTENDGDARVDDKGVLKGQPHIKLIEALRSKIYINKEKLAE